MALRLIYLTLTKLLGWMVLHTRSDTTKEIEILVWVPRTVSQPLISAFAASRPRSHGSYTAQQDRSRGSSTRVPDARPRPGGAARPIRGGQGRRDPGCSVTTSPYYADTTRAALTWIDRTFLSALSKLLPTQLRRLRLVSPLDRATAGADELGPRSPSRWKWARTWTLVRALATLMQDWKVSVPTYWQALTAPATSTVYDVGGGTRTALLTDRASSRRRALPTGLEVTAGRGRQFAIYNDHSSR